MLPAVENVMGALVWPAPIAPVSNPAPVAVCEIESAFFQATFWPTFTVAGFGLYDCAPAMPLIVIVTSAVDPGVAVGVGFGDVVGDEYELPHAAAATTAVTTASTPRLLLT